MLKKALLLLVFIAIGLWMNNTSIFLTKSSQYNSAKVIAHRGIHQVYAGEIRTNDTCRAQTVEPFSHHYIENTLPSIRDSFKAGADVVELDVHLTTDGVFAVFHDWRLECQTNGVGVTGEQSFSYLKTLDLGFNFTADENTYPLRGSGVGLMPSLEDVFNENNSGKYLVNIKSRRPEEGKRMAELLTNDAYRQQVYGVYGGIRPTQIVLDEHKDLRGFHRSSIKDCLLRYALVGWSGYVPKLCRNTIVAIPVDYAQYLWGWPSKFSMRMNAVGTDIILMGVSDDSGFSNGIDTQSSLELIPESFQGFIWTNKIENIGKRIKQGTPPL